MDKNQIKDKNHVMKYQKKIHQNRIVSEDKKTKKNG